MNAPALLDPADTVILLLDHQNGLFQTVKDVPLAELRTNVVVLAKVAKLAKIPLITTASVPDGPNGPLMHELQEVAPDATYVPRKGEISAWDNEDFVRTVKNTGRKTLIIAGVWTSVCVAFPACRRKRKGTTCTSSPTRPATRARWLRRRPSRAGAGRHHPDVNMRRVLRDPADVAATRRGAIRRAVRRVRPQLPGRDGELQAGPGCRRKVQDLSACGWTEFQFAERRMPTLDEINAASGDTPVFVLHLFERGGRDAGLLGGGLRGFPRAPARPARCDGAGTHRVVRLLVEHRWPFRLHATYDESIGRFLDVFEAVNRDVPFDGLRWFFDHAETITERNLERVEALGGGIAVQHRMAYQGEYFIDRYGAEAAWQTPPIGKMLQMGIPVGAGTDATRVASYNPWVALYWLVAGKTVGGTPLYREANRLDRMEALRRYTRGSAWFSGDEDKKGAIAPGQLADLAVLSADYFSVPEEEIKGIESVLTLVGGQVVYGEGEFTRLAPPALPVPPDWSPVKAYGGYRPFGQREVGAIRAHACAHGTHGLWHRVLARIRRDRPEPLWGGPGCECFAF